MLGSMNVPAAAVTGGYQPSEPAGDRAPRGRPPSRTAGFGTVASILDITNQLPDEEACLGYIERLRWPEGVACLRCAEKKISRISSRGKTGKPRHLFQCLTCRTQFTVRTGTIFQDSHLPLTTWFKAITVVSGSKRKMNPTRLMRELNVQYRTASSLLLRIQKALESGGRLEI